MSAGEGNSFTAKTQRAPRFFRLCSRAHRIGLKKVDDVIKEELIGIGKAHPDLVKVSLDP
jgi:hypothetical protein